MEEIKPGDIMLYRERPQCYVVRVKSTPHDDEMYKFELEIIHILENRYGSSIGKVFEVSHRKTCGFGFWHLFKLNDEYAQRWLKDVDMAKFI